VFFDEVQQFGRTNARVPLRLTEIPVLEEQAAKQVLRYDDSLPVELIARDVISGSWFYGF